MIKIHKSVELFILKLDFKFTCPECSNEKLAEFTFRELTQVDRNRFAFLARCLKCNHTSRVTSIKPPPAKFTYPPKSKLNDLYDSGINLWLTDFCNQSCNYCLAKPWIYNEEKQSSYITMEKLQKVVDWLTASPLQNTLQIMGGEPLTHPNIIELVKFLVNSPVEPSSILTNGLCDPKITTEIKRLKPDISFCINVDHPETYSRKEWNRIIKNLENCHFPRSKRQVSSENLKKAYQLNLAFTLHTPEQPFEYIIDLAKKYEVTAIRYAPASPASDLSNDYVDFNKLKKIKPTLLNFVKKAAKNKIKPNLDCTLPPCLFTIDEWHFMMNFTTNLKTSCDPILDLLPDLRMGYCACTFDLFDFFDLNEDNPAHKLKKIVSQANKARNIVPERCQNCDFFHDNICQGHCLRYKKDE